MAKRDEIEAQIAELQHQLDSADDDYEVRLRNDKGHEVTMPASRASDWLSEHFGIGGKPAAGEGGEGGDGKEPKEPAADPKPAGGGYFNRRKG